MYRFQNSLLFFCIIGLLCLLSTPQLSIAQDVELKVGDRIDVKFLNEWYDAEVTEIVRQGFMLKATFTDKKGRERVGHLFGKSSFRPSPDSNPANIDLLPREWTSADGKFSIKATFVEMNGDNVKLQKDDGTNVTVPLVSLCLSDNKYLKELVAGNDNAPRAANNNSDIDGTGESVARPSLDNIPMMEIATNRPFQVFASELQAGDRSTRRIDFGDQPFSARVQGLVFGRDNEKAVGSVQLTPGSRGEMGLFEVDMNSGRILNKLLLPESQTIVCDISVDGTMLLTKSNVHTRGNRIDVWKLDGKKITPHASWELPDDSDMFKAPVFASFTSDDRVVTLSRGGQLIIWDVDPLVAVAWYRAPQRYSGFTGNAFQISNDRKYFYSIINGSADQPSELVSFDLVNLKCLGSTKFDNSNNSLAVAPSGNRVAVLGKGILTIFDGEMNVIDEMSASFEGYRDNFRWVDDRFLLMQRAADVTVFDTESRVPLWRYMALGMVTMGEQGSMELLMDNNGNWWVSNTVGQKCQLHPFALPHESAVAKIPANPDEMILFKQGMTVSIEFKIDKLNPVELQQIRDHFVEELEKQGLTVVDSNADLQFWAGSELGESQRAEYQDMQGGGQRETVTAQTTNLGIQITDKKGIAWERVGSSGGDLMSVIIVPEGQSAQSAAGGSFTSASFFLETRFPMHVVRRIPGGAFGFSTIDQGKIVDASRK